LNRFSVSHESSSAFSRLDLHDIAAHLIETAGKAVPVVVGLDVRKRRLKLKLALLELAEDGFDRPACCGHFTDLLAQCVLPAPDIVQPFPQVDALIAAPLECGALLRIGQPRQKRCHRLFGVGLAEVRAGRVEIGLIFLDFRERKADVSEARLQVLDILASPRGSARLQHRSHGHEQCEGGSEADRGLLRQRQCCEQLRRLVQIEADSLSAATAAARKKAIQASMSNTPPHSHFRRRRQGLVDPADV
jgi:hypothetical protein